MNYRPGHYRVYFQKGPTANGCSVSFFLWYFIQMFVLQRHLTNGMDSLMGLVYFPSDL